MAALEKIEQIDRWTLMQDKDEFFGILGYAATLESDKGGELGTMVLYCTVKSDSYHSGLQFTSQTIDFSALATAGYLSGLARWDEEQTLEATFKAQKSRIEWDLFGINAAVSKYIRNIGSRQRLVLGFTVNGERVAIPFDLAGSRAAVEKFFSMCERGNAEAEPANVEGPAEGPVDARSSREKAQWVQKSNRRGHYSSLTIEAGDCVEIHTLKRRRNDLLTIDYQTGPGKFRREEYPSGDAVISGPQERIEVFFGERASDGIFESRLWTPEQGKDCSSP